MQFKRWSKIVEVNLDKRKNIDIKSVAKLETFWRAYSHFVDFIDNLTHLEGRADNFDILIGD